MSETHAPARLSAQEVLDTVGYPGFVRSLFNRTGDPAKDFAHAVLGVVTEVYELRAATDEVNAVEEFGDLMFYCEALEQVIGDYLAAAGGEYKDACPGGHRFDSGFIFIEFADPRKGREFLNDSTNNLLDAAKRWVGYGKAPGNCSGLLGQALYLSNMTLQESGFSAQPAIARLVNIEKLLERYNGMDFDADRAVNRNLVAERSVLEHAAAAA